MLVATTELQRCSEVGKFTQRDLTPCESEFVQHMAHVMQGAVHAPAFHSQDINAGISPRCLNSELSTGHQQGFRPQNIAIWSVQCAG